MQKKISLVVSVYNEEKGIEEFYGATTKVMESVISDGKWDYELIFVNDGSLDGSLNILTKFAEANDKVKVVNFAVNRGHEAAMIAGIDYAKSDALICMDADLQHPPEVIPEIIKKFDEGYDVVSMVRTGRKDGGIIKKVTSSAFYRIMNKMSKANFENNSSDFFAISNRVAMVLREDYRERVRFLRGYVQNVGFKKTTVEFEAGARVAGESNYNLRTLVKLSLNAICNFSDAPLKIGIYAGIVSLIAAFILMIYSVVQFFLGNAPDGYSTIIVVLCIMFGVLFMILGFISEYLAIIFLEVKGRPIYIVESIIQKDNIDVKDNKSED
ncbi:MAG: glycosyltransferase family 2 protein [Pseudobutyrivibrio sp.]|nr:glycosyltransferase family 2 protein [Pseudobutyrivibrio sp.]